MNYLKSINRGATLMETVLDIALGMLFLGLTFVAGQNYTGGVFTPTRNDEAMRTAFRSVTSAINKEVEIASAVAYTPTTLTVGNYSFYAQGDGFYRMDATTGEAIRLETIPGNAPTLGFTPSSAEFPSRQVRATLSNGKKTMTASFTAQMPS